MPIGIGKGWVNGAITFTLKSMHLLLIELTTPVAD